METTLNNIVINQLNHFLETLNSSDKLQFRKTLLNLKHSQEEELFALEQEYLNLVRDRRTSLINFLKNSETIKSSKRNINDQLKEMHSRTQHDLATFLKTKVFQGWQATSFSLQIEELKRSGVPKGLFLSHLQQGGREREISETDKVFTISYYREMVKYLLFALDGSEAK